MFEAYYIKRLRHPNPDYIATFYALPEPLDPTPPYKEKYQKFLDEKKYWMWFKTRITLKSKTTGLELIREIPACTYDSFEVLIELLESSQSIVTAMTEELDEKMGRKSKNKTSD